MGEPGEAMVFFSDSLDGRQTDPASSLFIHGQILPVSFVYFSVKVVGGNNIEILFLFYRYGQIMVFRTVCHSITSFDHIFQKISH